MTQPPRRWAYLYFAVLLPCLIYSVFYTARAVRLDYTPVPFWDAWRCVQYADQLLRFDLRHFWVQHNDHRIVFQEMIFALDYIFFRGEEWLPIAASIFCQAVQLGILWWLLRQMREVPLAFRLAFGAACGLFMANGIQVQVILSPFLLQWYLSQMAAALAFVFLWRSGRTGGWVSLGLAALSAVVVTYSTGNGMLLWPILVAMAALLRLPRPRIAVLALAGVCCIAAYFVGYTFMGQGRTFLFLGHPFYAVWFVGVFLGTPLSYGSAFLGGITGLAGLVGVAWAVTVAIRQRRLGEPALFVSAGVCLYIACSALMIAYGRMAPNDVTVNAARAERYASVPLAYWANLVVLAAWLAGRLKGFTFHLVAAAMAIVILAAVMRPQRALERAFAAQQERGNETGMALVAGVYDDDLIHVIFPDSRFIRAKTPTIRQKRLSIFAAGRQDWLGQPVSRAFPVASRDACSGGLKEVTAIDGGYRATGTIDRAGADVVLTDAAGKVIGIGGTWPPGKKWVAFARADQTTAAVQAWAVVDGGKGVCALGAPQPVPHAQAIDASRVGAAIHISGWKADAAWTRNGFHPSVGTLAGEILYGSYSGSDANQGKLTSDEFAADGHCVILPAAHGPSTIGQTIRLVEAASGKAVVSVPLSDTPGTWQYWSIDLQGAGGLRIVAEDNGSAWGQWIAVGEPHQCKSH